MTPPPGRSPAAGPALRPPPGAVLAPILAAALLLPAAEAAAQPAGAASRPGGWRAELTADLLEPWTRNARRAGGGPFRTHLDRRWRPAGPPEQYPSMLGRHLFSYAAGYLVTGEERWLALADSVRRYLVRHAWDERHGGWYDRLAADGGPADRSKSTFVQVYAATGLALHHFVTRRPGSLRRVRRTNRLLETRFRDEENGGYFQQLARDFTVEDSSKTAASQLAPVSGHLLYLYAGTRDTSYLRQAARLTRIAAGRMRDPATGWSRERFTPDWRPAPGSGPAAYNVGHNLEVAWLLARLHLAGAGALRTGEGPGVDRLAPAGGDGLRRRALELGERVAEAGYLEETGAWVQQVSPAEARRGGAGPASGRVLWWIQAYGNMTQLTLHRVRAAAPAGPAAASADRGTAAGPFLRRYRKGVAFWRRHLLDRRHGASFTAVGPDGGLRDGGKGGKWKTSYHAVEHALWNLLGEALWLRPGGAVTLHFRPAPGGGDRPLRRVCPRPVPDPSVAIASARRGGRELDVAPAAACFRVRAGGPPVRVELEGGGSPPERGRESG